MSREPFYDEKWQGKMGLRYDFTNCISAAVGEEHGLKYERLQEFFSQGEELIKRLVKEKEAGTLGFANLPYDHDLREDIQRYILKSRRRFKYIIVLGIGGSALGTTAVRDALIPNYSGLRSRMLTTAPPQVIVIDNVDPDFVSYYLDYLDLSACLINVISKSGSTAETLTEFLVFRSALIEKVGRENHGQHIIVTTSEGKGYLYNIAQEEHYQLFYVPENVGGRFSVLSAVGLLPLAVGGVDILQLQAGAEFMANIIMKSLAAENPAFIAALIQYLLGKEKNKSIQVIFPYCNCLYSFGLWWRQLWAESLGKKNSISGAEVFSGQTPALSLGVTDQHSQIQLYNEGPNNKAVTFLEVEKFSQERLISSDMKKDSAIEYLQGKSLNQLIAAEKKATELALTQAQRPNSTVLIPEINPFTIGQLIFLFEAITCFAGWLYEINPFDQPGVEAGKKATYALMGRKGYEKQGEELRQQLSKIKRYLI
jgi:glucose-6-phosphate isomerase